jgi:hypothetical protein
VWVEFFLANLLRDQGAVVKSFHIPARDGRRQTFATADGQGKIVEPPFHAWEAKAAADIAGQRARQQDSWRESLPRNKPSPKLNEAIKFVSTQNNRKMTKEVIKTAEGMGISKSTLGRALKIHSISSPSIP